MQNNKFDSLCNKILLNINENYTNLNFWKEFQSLPVYKELRQKLSACYQKSGLNTENPSYYDMYEELKDALSGLPPDQQKLCANTLKEISDEETESLRTSREKSDYLPPRE